MKVATQTPAERTNGVHKIYGAAPAKQLSVSYAQTGEDVVLDRAFAGRTTGFYIDIGACDPVIDSVTMRFYERGWRGVNVEPDCLLHASFLSARIRDTNVCAAVGDERGQRMFYPTSTRGHGTLDGDIATTRTEGRPPERVPVMTLSDVFDYYGPVEEIVDFLKIDVEGLETEVVGSADWSRHRPRVVVIEAVDLFGAPTFGEWEPILLNAGYAFALSDGLNRFYCRREDSELLPYLAVPANPIDNWIRASERHAHEVVANLQSQVDETRRETADANEKIGQMATELEVSSSLVSAAGQRADESALLADKERAAAACANERGEALAVELVRSRAEAAAALRREEEVEERLAKVGMELVRLESETEDHRRLQIRDSQERQNLLFTLAKLATQRYDAEAALAEVLASTSWRFTRPLRIAVRLFRGRTVLQQLRGWVRTFRRR